MSSSDPILKDRGLVLRWYPVTDTSRIVIWFTRQYGRVATLARGSQRPKSWVLGQFDLFYTCEVLFYARAREDLHPLRECSPLARRSNFRYDWRACAGASFVCDLLSRLTPPRASAPVLYEQAARTLDLLCEQGISPALLFWFELQALRDLGVAPDYALPEAAQLYFDIPQGRLRAHPGEDQRLTPPLTRGSLTCLQELLGTSEPSRLSRLRLLPEQVSEIADHLQEFTRWHLDLDLRSRARALAWI